MSVGAVSSEDSRKRASTEYRVQSTEQCVYRVVFSVHINKCLR